MTLISRRGGIATLSWSVSKTCILRALQIFAVNRSSDNRPPCHLGSTSLTVGHNALMCGCIVILASGWWSRARRCHGCRCQVQRQISGKGAAGKTG